MAIDSSRLEEIASAAEVITGKPADIYCDEGIYTDVIQEKTHCRIGLGSISVHMEECEIHALGKLMHSPVNWIDVRIEAGPQAADLFAALEHKRIDRITSVWYDRDMVTASAKHINCISSGKDFLAQELLHMLYGKPLPNRSIILEKYWTDIEAAIQSSSPAKALETAIAIAQEAGSAVSEPLPDTAMAPDTPAQSVAQEKAETARESAKTLVNSVSKTKVKLEGIRDHQYRIFHPDMIPFKGMEYCGYILDQWTGSKPLYKTAISGAPKHNTWAINYGKTKVFNKRIVSAGKVVVLVDLSASMEGFSSDKQPGYLAFQAANLITGSAGGSDVDLYGFTGSFSENIIIPLKAGYVPQCPARYSDESPLLGFTPMCVALQFLSALYKGTEASIAVLITDGNPSAAADLSQEHVIEHTRELAYNLYEGGMRYLLIQVKTEGLEQLYPVEITVHVNCDEDLFQIPLAMSVMKNN